MKPTLETQLRLAEEDMAENLTRVMQLRTHATGRWSELAQAERDLSANLTQIAALRVDLAERNRIIPEPPLGTAIAFTVQYRRGDAPYTYLALRIDTRGKTDVERRWVTTKTHSERMTWGAVVELMKQHVDGLNTPAYIELAPKNVPF